MPDSRNYLHPEAIKRIARLDLRAQHVVEGFLAGMQRSPYFGQSVEFLQHRQYTPGDDLRHVDWQVWARQDRLYVKQFEEDTNLRVNLLVDVSRSMNYGSPGWTKFDCAATIAASLAYLVLQHQDAVGCLTFDQQVQARLPTLGRRDQLAALLALLETTTCQGKTGLQSVFAEAARTFPRRGMMVVISDLLADPEETLRGLRLLRQRGHDVLVFHVLDDDELDFNFRGPTRFAGLESDQELRCNPQSLREGYLAELQQYLDTLRHQSARARVDYQLVRSSAPLDAVLATFLSRRMARSR